MTAIKSDDTPEQWSKWDDIAVEVYSHLDLIERIGDFNALVFFADQLFINEVNKRIELDPEDAHIMHQFLDDAIKVDTILQKYLGKDYIGNYIEQHEIDWKDDNE
jgi:hypothetical protein